MVNARVRKSCGFLFLICTHIYIHIYFAVKIKLFFSAEKHLLNGSGHQWINEVCTLTSLQKTLQVITSQMT